MALDFRHGILQVEKVLKCWILVFFNNTARFIHRLLQSPFKLIQLHFFFNDSWVLRTLYSFEQRILTLFPNRQLYYDYDLL